MNNDQTPHNMQVPAIPVLTDIITRGAKAPPLENDVLDESAFTADEPETLDSTMEVDSEAITVYPGLESTDDPAPQKPFSLDEITESLENSDEDSEEDTQTDDPVEKALQSLMPKLETMAREALKIALIDIKSEKSSHKKDDEETSD